MHSLSVICWFLCLISLSVVVPAQAQAPLLNDYPGARVVFSSTSEVSDYVLALGTYRKVGGLMRVEHQRLAGKLTRKTYELPDNHSSQDGFTYFYRQLAGYPLRELYRCQGRECGQSNNWANDHFGILQLYGLDQHQHYGAFELIGNDHLGVYVTLYSVLRGNRRVFVQVEILESGHRDSYRVASNPDTLLMQLQRDGYTPFLRLDYSDTGADAELGDNHLDALARALEQSPDLVVAVVGHNYEPVSSTEQRQRSQKVAEKVREALVKRGIDADRLRAEGLGSLAPAGRGDSRVRVDIVLQPSSAQ